MKVSLANILKTELEKMSVFASEQKLMKTRELCDYEQMLIITKGLIRRRGRKQSGKRRFRSAELHPSAPSYLSRRGEKCGLRDCSRLKVSKASVVDMPERRRRHYLGQTVDAVILSAPLGKEPRSSSLDLRPRTT